MTEKNVCYFRKSSQRPGRQAFYRVAELSDLVPFSLLKIALVQEVCPPPWKDSGVVGGWLCPCMSVCVFVCMWMHECVQFPEVCRS